MSRKKQRPPSEKKALSYANDCRNTYGENDKASRKAIPLRKAMENRQNRRKVTQDIKVLPALSDESAATVESSARQDMNRVGGWKKGSDAPLSEFLELQARRRSWRDLGPNRKPNSQESDS